MSPHVSNLLPVTCLPLLGTIKFTATHRKSDLVGVSLRVTLHQNTDGLDQMFTELFTPQSCSKSPYHTHLKSVFSA